MGFIVRYVFEPSLYHIIEVVGMAAAAWLLARGIELLNRTSWPLSNPVR